MKERILTDLKIFIIDNSPLTGESIAVTATKECGEKDRKDTLEVTNLVFLFELFSFVGVCASIGEFITSASEDYVPITQNNNKYKKNLPNITLEELKDLKKNYKKYSSTIFKRVCIKYR